MLQFEHISKKAAMRNQKFEGGIKACINWI